MDLNPFDNQLLLASQRLTDTRSKLQSIRHSLDWFNGTDLETLVRQREQLRLASEAHSHDCQQISREMDRTRSELLTLSKEMKSLWNPTSWFDSRERELRARAAELKKSFERTTTNYVAAQGKLAETDRKRLAKAAEVSRYEGFNQAAANTECAQIESQLALQEAEVERITLDKQRVDAALEPIIAQINETERKQADAVADRRCASMMDEELSSASNSYERAMVHQACEDQFGTGSPRKVASRKDEDIRRYERDLEKLRTRAKNVAEKAAREVRKLVVDGNNLCYEGERFIGLEALKVLVPSLTAAYEVTVVFDASIRRVLDRGDSEIRDALGKSVNVHVVATSMKADETVLDLAGADRTAFVLSNDRFAEFGEKAAVQERRVIRHEIVAGQVLIHDLGVSATIPR